MKRIAKISGLACAVSVVAIGCFVYLGSTEDSVDVSATQREVSVTTPINKQKGESLGDLIKHFNPGESQVAHAQDSLVR